MSSTGKSRAYTKHQLLAATSTNRRALYNPDILMKIDRVVFRAFSGSRLWSLPLRLGALKFQRT